MVGKRVDAYLSSRFPDYSRSVMQKVIDAQAALVNDQPVKASYKVRLDDQIRVWLPELADDAPVPEDIPINVVYEDAAFTLVNKPAGMVVHPAKGHWTGTLAGTRFSSITTHFPRSEGALPARDRSSARPRYDRPTVGVAKRRPRRRQLAALVRTANDPEGMEYLAARLGLPRTR